MTASRYKEQLKVLGFLAFFDDGDYFPFAPIMDATELNRATVRRACRYLKRKGFTKFYAGLCDEDGEFIGSGYAATEAGREWLKAQSHDYNVE